jgi:hypothetical protein
MYANEFYQFQVGFPGHYTRKAPQGWGLSKFTKYLVIGFGRI